jgi:tRNA pseudouridine55 synthase
VKSRRGATGLAGILPVDKPAGITSHDLVNVVRSVTGERRVGHAGTLDPAATGLLVVLVGPATRLAPYLSGAYKTYVADVVFGDETDTDDAEGTPTRSAAVPPELVEDHFARQALQSVVGEQEQMPPSFSAIKIDGKAAYRSARAGQQPDLQPRHIEVREADLLEVIAGDRLTWVVRFDVSKGTYIRALARDIGRSLGTAAHLGALRRTRSGSLMLEDAHSLSEVESAGPTAIAGLFADPVSALALPSVELGAETGTRVANGVPLDVAEVEPGLPDGPVCLTREGRLVAVYEKRGARLVPAVVFPEGVASK